MRSCPPTKLAAWWRINDKRNWRICGCVLACKWAWPEPQIHCQWKWCAAEYGLCAGGMPWHHTAFPCWGFIQKLNWNTAAGEIKKMRFKCFGRVLKLLMVRDKAKSGYCCWFDGVLIAMPTNERKLNQGTEARVIWGQAAEGRGKAWD